MIAPALRGKKGDHATNCLCVMRHSPDTAIAHQIQCSTHPKSNGTQTTHIHIIGQTQPDRTTSSDIIIRKRRSCVLYIGRGKATTKMLRYVIRMLCVSQRLLAASKEETKKKNTKKLLLVNTFFLFHFSRVFRVRYAALLLAEKFRCFIGTCWFVGVRDDIRTMQTTNAAVLLITK